MKGRGQKGGPSPLICNIRNVKAYQILAFTKERRSIANLQEKENEKR
jgi:hypothetical protein